MNIFLFSVSLFPIFILGGSWAEETLVRMSLEEKIGQLFIAPACPLREEDHFEDWVQLMEEFHIGGTIVKQSNPESHVRLVNRLQKASDLPLLITADAEWGLSMRMTDTIRFPRNQVLGEMKDLDLIREIGFEIGKQCKRVGIHLNFSPVADVNTNPDNPVIGSRSFGDDPNWVAQCVVAMLEGLQSGGVMACAKHFPGHGDTGGDSHLGLPVLLHDRARLENVELVPFKAAIAKKVSAIMSAHILVSCIDDRFPCTLSCSAMSRLLREEMKFEGLIITDALNMRALSLFYSPEEIAYFAFLAGSDLLLYGDHKGPNVDDILHNQIPSAYRFLLSACRSNKVSVSVLDDKVLRILRAKEAHQLHVNRMVVEEGVRLSLHSSEAVDLRNRIESKSSPK